MKEHASITVLRTFVAHPANANTQTGTLYTDVLREYDAVVGVLQRVRAACEEALAEPTEGHPFGQGEHVMAKYVLRVLDNG